jgi:hypothetical protein
VAISEVLLSHVILSLTIESARNFESRQGCREDGFDQGLLSGYHDPVSGISIMLGEKSPRDTKGIQSVLKPERG